MNQTNIASEKESQWLEKLVGRNLLEKVLCSFSKSTGLKAMLVDTKGNALISTSHEIQDCSFCSKIRADSLGIRKCQRSYAQACTEAAKYGEPYIFRCHAGLIMWAAPIVLDQYVFSIICGQVLMWEPEDYFLEEIEEMVKGLDIDVAGVKWAAAQLEVMSSDKVQAAADLLFIVANQIMKSGLTVLEQRRNITAQQARLAEEIQARKRSEVAMRTIESRTNSINSLDKEHELKTLVRNGEKRAAQQLLEKLLVDILERNSENIDTVKTRVVELVVFISRAAVDGGADLSVILQQNALFFLELLKITHTDEICLWSRDMLETYMKQIDNNRDQKNQQAIQYAAEYIKKNFRNKITTEDIARVVYLSPCYVSRIFKQGLGCTLTEYLTKVRVEEAKKMLKDPKYNVMKVAEESGFDDPAYFTRVFKKTEGITPSSFRQHAL
ncbi:PocR ligand-binding domain-containing protein [Desulfosporosinus metallidurans]|uniref:PocR ligand-binding domain-containing protein n=1 Tax=Desulfosporosinus metallidurans TaxID=1888891 RepID=UPI00094C8A06|nr:PocR ligand-binding domain-containing protein [Desulfosporosinus metallidurans]